MTLHTKLHRGPPTPTDGISEHTSPLSPSDTTSAAPGRICRPEFLITEIRCGPAGCCRIGWLVGLPAGRHWCRGVRGCVYVLAAGGLPGGCGWPAWPAGLVSRPR